MNIACRVTSFGRLHGPPPSTATIVLDTRVLLRDPHVDPRMRQLTGLDPEVIARVHVTPGAKEMIGTAVTMVRQLLSAAGDPAGLRVDVAVGCAGGRHRSVAIATSIATELTGAGIGVALEHRDLHRPVVEH